MFSASDYSYMARAIRLAKNGLYTTKPNPIVGCVIVQGDTVVGEGFHERAGLPHAEINALTQAGKNALGATAYVTLEPCAHFGRTPPCSDALIEAGVSRLVYGAKDPNPLVGGAGLQRMREAGIAVQGGLLEGECSALNAGFMSRITRGRPYVRVKLGASLDARTAMQDGKSQWITSPESRHDVQRLRARSGAILTGAGTVREDNPSFRVRTKEIGLTDSDIVQPIRVIVGTLPAAGSDLQLVLDAEGVHWFVPQSQNVSSTPDRLNVRSVPDREGRVDVLPLLQELARMEVNDVLVEAGPTLAGSFIREKLCDELIVYIAPKLMGHLARPLVELPNETLDESPILDLIEMAQVGTDIKLTYRVVN